MRGRAPNPLAPTRSSDGGERGREGERKPVAAWEATPNGCGWGGRVVGGGKGEMACGKLHGGVWGGGSSVDHWADMTKPSCCRALARGCRSQGPDSVHRAGMRGRLLQRAPQHHMDNCSRTFFSLCFKCKWQGWRAGGSWVEIRKLTLQVPCQDARVCLPK